MVRQRSIGNGLERFRTTCTEVKDAGNPVFQEPQVYRSHVAYVNEITFEVFTAFKQFWRFAIVKLGVEVESNACHAAFVAFTRSVDVEIAEANNL